MLLGVLDHFAIGVLIVDDRANVLHANNAARALLGEPIRLSDCASDTFPFGRVKGCIRSVIAQTSGRALALRSDATDRSLFVMVSPIERGDDETVTSRSWPSRAALVVMCDSDRAPSVPAEIMAAVFGLTEAEARVAEAASSGSALGEIAGRLGVSPNTVKTHLRRVYEKTGTKRQAELARVMAVIGMARPDLSRDSPPR